MHVRPAAPNHYYTTGPHSGVSQTHKINPSSAESPELSEVLSQAWGRAEIALHASPSARKSTILQLIFQISLSVNGEWNFYLRVNVLFFAMVMITFAVTDLILNIKSHSVHVARHLPSHFLLQRAEV